MRYVLVALLLLTGCAVDLARKQAVVGCMNLRTALFAWECPERLQTPTLPQAAQ